MARRKSRKKDDEAVEEVEEVKKEEEAVTVPTAKPKTTGIEITSAAEADDGYVVLVKVKGKEERVIVPKIASNQREEFVGTDVKHGFYNYISENFNSLERVSRLNRPNLIGRLDLKGNI